MKRICILTFSFLALLQTGAQGLTIGDACPDLPITNILNYKGTSAKISDFKGKLLILNFMTSDCLSCLRALPKLDSLQQQYQNDLQILLVTYEPKEKIEKFMSKSSIGKEIKLPFATGDSLLKAHFPHEYISHEVWIDKMGTVKAITGSKYVQSVNITKVLAGDKITWPVKRDVKEYDYSQPILTLNESNIPDFSLPAVKYYSAFTSYMDNVPRRSDVIFDSITKTVKVYMINVSIMEMYLMAFGLQITFPNSRMIIDVADFGRLAYNRNGTMKQEWKQNNTFCYDATLPLEAGTTLRKNKIKNDLDFYFNLNGRVENRQVECLVLVRNGKANKSFKRRVKKGEQTGDLMTASLVVHTLNHSYYNKPVFNESGLSNQDYLAIDKNAFSNLTVLQEHLQQYGLKLNKEWREVEMFVLTDQ